MARLIIFLLVFSVGATTLVAQGPSVKRYPLPRRVMPLEKALIKLVEAGAPISYRSDQLPKITVKVPGGRRQLSAWLQFLLRDTELIFRPGPAGFLILPDPDLFSRNITIHEKDIVNVARLLPGITSGANGVGGLIFRGGNSGHNLILLDGVPVYNLNHAAGLFSIFNSEAIRRADVYKDGMPARFGGRIGGVLDVHTRDGNLYNHQVTTGTSLLAANLTAEGPISKGKSSYLLSGRYFWGSPLLRAFSKREKKSLKREGVVDYAVQDLNFKLNQQVGEKGRLYLSIYHGEDGYSNSSEQRDSLTILTQSGTIFEYEADQKRTDVFNWSNTVGALRYNHQFTDRFFGNFRLSYSDMLVRADFERSDILVETIREDLNSNISSGRFGSDIKQTGLAFDGQLELGAESRLRFGASADANRFLPQLRSGRVALSTHPELSSLKESDALRSTQLAAYASLKGRFIGLHYRLGLRGQFWINESTFFNLSPRLLVAGRFNTRNRWRLTYDRLAQPIHLVSSTLIRLPTDFWVPATTNLPPSTSEQVAFQVDRDLAPGWQLTVAGYHRQLRHLVEYSGGNSNSSWLDNLSTGKGFANGVELTLHRKRGKLAGWLNYTLAQSRRQFDEEVNLGHPFAFDYDRRHSVKLLLTLALSNRTDLTATWRYETGGAYSFSSEIIVLSNPAIDDPDTQEQVIADSLSRYSSVGFCQPSRIK